MVTVCGRPLEENFSNSPLPPPQVCSEFNSIKTKPQCSLEAHKGRILCQCLAGCIVKQVQIFPLVRIHYMIKLLGTGMLYISLICLMLSSV